MTLQVIGVGFSRTGTMSLKFAIELLGFGRCYHMSEVAKHPQYAAYWERVAAGETVDWDEVFAGYGATTDHPPCFFYKPIMAHYPNAKLILTLRDEESWCTSMQSTLLSEERQKILGTEARARAANPIARMLDKVYPVDRSRVNDREYLKSVYRAHNADVLKTVPPEKLLVYNVAEGWGPLCRFLDKPIPQEPFPATNSAEEFRARDKAWLETGTRAG